MKLRLDYQGEHLTLEEIAAKSGLSVSAVQRRRIGNRVMDAAEYAAMPAPEHPRAKRLFYRGESLTVREWSKKTGIPYYTLWARIHRYGWPLKYALTAPLSTTAFDTITFRGVTMTVSEWASIVGIPTDALRLRLTRYGWPVERALTEPAIPLAHRNVIARNRRIIRRIAASFHARTPTATTMTGGCHSTFRDASGTGGGRQVRDLQSEGSASP